MHETDVDSYFCQNIFDISQSPHRIAYVEKFSIQNPTRFFF